jgi:hypothetical protein
MRKNAKAERLANLERDFAPLLKLCLNECAQGRWGLFGRNDSPEIRRYHEWAEADLLKEMAGEIVEMRGEFGIPNALVERFLYYLSLKGPNDPGEPKLAAAFLEEINFARFMTPE